MRRRRSGDEGSVAAELAVAVPAVLVVLLLGVSALGAAARQVTLQDAAADAARLLGRGESAAAATAAVTRAVPGARVSAGAEGDFACVTAHAEVHVGRIISIPLQASSCALAGGL